MRTTWKPFSKKTKRGDSVELSRFLFLVTKILIKGGIDYECKKI